MRSLTKREWITVAIGSTCIVGLLLTRSEWAQSATADQSWRSRVGLEEANPSLARFLLAMEKQIADSARTRRSAVDALNSSALPARSIPDGQSRLAQWLTDLCNDAGVSVMALRMLPDTTAYGPYRQVSVRLELRSDYEGITTLAIAIEGSGKLVRIRKLEIASEGRNSTAEESLQLRGTLTVDALTLSSAESEQ